MVRVRVRGIQLNHTPAVPDSLGEDGIVTLDVVERLRGLAGDSVAPVLEVLGIDAVGADIRFAFRFFARKPLSSATIVLALAFGIGGSAAQVSFVQSAIVRPLPGVPRDVPVVLVRGTVRESRTGESGYCAEQ